ncbi:MAG: phosphatase PAP2 family protein [Bacillota bacterium]
MEILQALAAVRTPFWNTVFGYLTYFGEQTVFMAVGLIVLWCVDKKWGYRLFYMGLLGSAVNQLLKGIFLLPRPWVVDPSFQIVESARAAATGYSFPSGHTQGAAMLFGGLALWIRKRWMTVLCVAVVLTVGFSRMYLGVHTPLDVGVSLLCGALMVWLMAYLFKKADSGRGAVYVIGGAGLLLCAASVLYVVIAPTTPKNVAEFDSHGLESTYTLLGAMLGLIVIWWLDDRYLRFPVKAVWWAQALKCAGGIGVLLLLRVALKQPLNALFHGYEAADAVRYFLITVAAGALWPMTFPFFSRLGRRKAD